MSAEIDGYSTGPFVAVRVWGNSENGYHIDAVDADENYSEFIWSFDGPWALTKDKAMEYVGEFKSEHGLASYLPIREIEE